MTTKKKATKPKLRNITTTRTVDAVEGDVTLAQILNPADGTLDYYGFYDNNWCFRSNQGDKIVKILVNGKEVNPENIVLTVQMRDDS